jgi:hypothetical protein
MSQSTEVSDEDYEYDYSDNDEDEDVVMDVNDEPNSSSAEELVSPTHKKAKHAQKSPSIYPRNSDAHVHLALLDSLDMGTFRSFPSWSPV